MLKLSQALVFLLLIAHSLSPNLAVLSMPSPGLSQIHHPLHESLKFLKPLCNRQLEVFEEQSPIDIFFVRFNHWIER